MKEEDVEEETGMGGGRGNWSGCKNKQTNKGVTRQNNLEGESLYFGLWFQGRSVHPIHPGRKNMSG